jgi:hypothetical protein
VPTAYALVAVIGFIWAVVMRAARPEAYAAIGRGADGRVSVLNEHPTTPLGLHADPVGARVHY